MCNAPPLNHILRTAFALLLITLTLTTLSPDKASAATLYWDGSGTGWNTASFWSTLPGATTPDPGAPPGIGDIAQFNISTVNTAQTVNLNAAQSALGLIFSSTGTVLVQTGAGVNTLSLGASGITVNSGSGADTLTSLLSLSAAQSWTNNSVSLLTVNGNIANGANLLTVAGTGSTTITGILGNGTGGLTKSGSGTLTLSGGNTYTGGTIINGGIVAAAYSGNDGKSALGNSNVTINAGGMVRVDNTNALGFGAGSPAITINSGGLMFTVAGATIHLGNLTLSGGTLNSPAPSGLASTFGTYSLDNNLTAGGTTATSTIPALGFALTTPGGTTFTVNPGATSGIDLDVTGTIAAPSGASNTALIKAGTGVLRLSGTNTWTAGTTINAGTINIAANAALGGTSAPLSFGGGTLQTTATFSLSSTRVITLNAGGGIFNTDSGTTLTITQTIGGAGGLTKTGSGNLTLSSNSNATSTFAGPVNVNDGTLTLTKTAGFQNGVISTTTVNIGDGIGAPGSAVLSASNAAFAFTGFPSISILQDGILSSGANNIANLTMTAGTVSTTDQLFITGNVTTLASTATATIGGSLIVAFGAPSVFNIAQGTTPSGIDLEFPGAIVDGLFPINKTGPGTMRLSGDNDALLFSGGVTVSAGTLRLGNYDSLGTGPLTLNGGIFQTEGTFILANPVTFASTGTINGTFDLTFSSGASGPGGFTKNGTFTLTFSGTNTFGGPITINAGTLVTSANSTFTGDVINNGTFVYNGGAFAGRLTNNGTFSFITNFTAGNGMENSGFITLAVGRTFTLNGAGLDNKGTINVSGGVLVLSTTATNFNSGNLNLSSSLALGAANLTNSGALTLTGGVITASTGSITNQASGVISGSGSITGPLTNSGTIALTAGNLHITQPFVNSGDIQLGSVAALLSGGAISNSASIGGFGKISSNVTNNGTIQPLSGSLVFTGTLVNSATGVIIVGSGAKVLMQGATTFPSNAGIINLAGGTFDNGGFPLNNTGLIIGYGVFNTGGLTNSGTITFIGGTTTIVGNVTNNVGNTMEFKYQPAIFTGTVTNNGTIKTTNTTVTFAGPYIGNGYISDPATNIFQDDVTIVAGGVMTGDVGDVFSFTTGNVTIHGVFTNGGTLQSASPITNHGTFTQTGILNLSANFTNHGTATLGGSQTWTNSPTVTNNAGTLTFQTNPGTASLLNLALNSGAINFSSTAALRQTPSVLLNLKSLTIASTGTLDATNHDLMIGNSNLATVEAQILKGFNLAGSPNAPAITSSSALANGNTFLVPIDADALLGNGAPGSAIGKIFDGTAITQPGTILVKYAYIGDVTLDGKIDGLDFATAAGHFNQSTPGLSNIQNAWLSGDINFDGTVNAQDFTLMNNNASLSQLSPLGILDLTPSQSPIPEPSTLLLLGASAVALLRAPRAKRYPLA